MTLAPSNAAIPDVGEAALLGAPSPAAAASALPASPIPAAPATIAGVPGAAGSSALLLWLVGAVAAVALLTTALLWQKLSNMQEQLARQSAEATAQSIEARAVSKAAQELARETAAKLAVTDARFSEVALQRSQLEELMQSLSRSRDENLVVDIESAVRLAQQQAQLTGSVEPLLAALKTADQRVLRAAQPRLTPLQRAIGRDVGRIKATALADTPALLNKMDELVRLADDIPVANAVATVTAMGSLKRQNSEPLPIWWQRALQVVSDEARGLLRVSRIEQPDAALMSPEQSFFVRENFKLKLLNARLGLLARQLESSRADLAAASMSLNKYFDPTSRKTQNAATVLQQVQLQMKTLELPRVDETLAALATAAAGR
jgi:uroporphyrin-III C-methyltransferase